MMHQRSRLASTTFASLFLLAAACGDDTGGAGGNGSGGDSSGGNGTGGNGTGGNGSTSSGTTSTTTTTSTSSGGGNVVCVDLANTMPELAESKGCNLISAAALRAYCEQWFADSPGCGPELTAYYYCYLAVGSGSWRCDPTTNDLVPHEGFCAFEEQKLANCLQD